MAVPDLLLLAWVALLAASGFLRGFAAQVLPLAGAVAGLLAGARLAPHLLPGGERSPWLPLATLAAAAIASIVLGLAAGGLTGRSAAFLAERPALRVVDRTGGALAGAALALALAWLFVVLLLQQPAFGLQSAVQRSSLLPGLASAVPPERVLRALHRFDPLPLLPALAPRALPPPEPTLTESAGARRAAASVVKIEGTSCGLAVQGSGWVARRGVVATNAHVVAGQEDTRVLTAGGQTLPASVVYLDRTNDVALLHVPSLSPPALRPDRTESFPERVALFGYPGDGPLTASPGTAGAPRSVLAPDAGGRRVQPRLVVPLRGRVRRGESGGPVVDRSGRVLAMIFAGTRDGAGGFAVPVELVLRGLRRPLVPVSAGACTG